MNKELVIVTKDDFKFTYTGEKAEQIRASAFEYEGLVHFGNKELTIPKDNLSYFWLHEREQ